MTSAPTNFAEHPLFMCTFVYFLKINTDTQELMEARADEQKAQAWAQQAGRLRFVETGLVQQWLSLAA